MTPEQAKEMLPLIIAFSEGKEIQYNLPGDGLGWQTATDLSFNFWYLNYRIKPELVQYKYKRYIYTNNNQSTLYLVTEEAVQDNLKVHGEKIRWIDTEWQYVEV